MNPLEAAMNKRAELPENLAVYARRGTLSPEQQQELERLVATSAALRAALVVGQAFDQADAVQPGDEAMVQRFVDGALRTRNRRFAGGAAPRRLVSWLLAAIVFGFCGLAFGLRGSWLPKLAFVRQPAAPVPASAAPKSATSRRVLSESREVASAETTSSRADTSVNPVPPRTNGSDWVLRSTSKEPNPESAALPAAGPSATDTQPPAQPIDAEEPGINAGALFRQANTARRLGQIDRAVALLQALQQNYPGSPETLISHVSLGKLYMTRGAAAAAAQEFSAYLASAGPLSEEAMLGRAQALAALGRSAEERQTWELLLVRYPHSVYAIKARERVRTLGK
jgi:TolA-binding protein